MKLGLFQLGNVYFEKQKQKKNENNYDSNKTHRGTRTNAENINPSFQENSRGSSFICSRQKI